MKSEIWDESKFQAIPTPYRGYLMRSRLEARWAVFLDNLDIKWEYETEGYRLRDGTLYLPDFWLPTFDGGMWMEVKPSGSAPEVWGKAIKLAESSRGKVWLAEGMPECVWYLVAKYEIYDGKGGVVFWWGAPNWADACGQNRMFGWTDGAGVTDYPPQLYMGCESSYIDYADPCGISDAVLAAKRARFRRVEN